MKLLSRGLVISVCLLSFYSIAGAAPAEVPQTGQTICYDSTSTTNNIIPCAGSGQDGEIQAGVSQPGSRFTDRDDGTVIDNLTGLIWLKDANCFGGANWADAINAARTLQNGDCGLSDGSSIGWWRLPNLRELMSLINYAYRNPALSNAAGTGQWQDGDPFTNVLGYGYKYWSSTTSVYRVTDAWEITIDTGWYGAGGKDDDSYVWPVREMRID